MCCFAGPVERVSNTRIFGRLDDGEQVLAYAMSVETRVPNAMVLPVPAASLSFVSLERYPTFFEALEGLFPVELEESLLVPVAASADLLKVEQVGAFDASFVPTMRDFERLDPRFRLPEGVWPALPKYRDYAFAVFQLQAGRLDVHPMAFRFKTRLADVLFFPTGHVHDGQVHDDARFDHVLYAQSPDGLEWQQSDGPAGTAIDTDRAQGLVDPALPVYRRFVMGSFPNRDIEVPGWEPAAA